MDDENREKLKALRAENKRLKILMTEMAQRAGKVAADKAAGLIHARCLTSINSDAWRQLWKDLATAVEEELLSAWKK